MNKILLSYDDIKGSFQVFNLTKSKKLEGGGVDYSEVFPISYTPGYPQVGQNENITLDIIQSMNSNSDYELALRVPGHDNKVILLNFIGKNFTSEPWFIKYLSNKGIIFTIVALLLITYQLCKSRPSQKDEDDQSFSKIKQKLAQTQSFQNQKLDEISQKLANFEISNKNMEDFNSQLGGLGNENLKSLLKTDKSPLGGSKKNVRFADFE